VLGQYAGIAALFLASAALSALALVVPAGWLPWLGLLPVLIGLRLLLARDGADSERPATGAMSVAAVTVANGGDNIGVYLPLFATSGAAEIAVMGAVFAAMTGLWCAAARWLARHPAAQAPVRRWAPRTVPWVLIALGGWILSRLFL
jgi:cadmium resistance protein CadD (predicted permease)